MDDENVPPEDVSTGMLCWCIYLDVHSNSYTNIQDYKSVVATERLLGGMRSSR